MKETKTKCIHCKYEWITKSKKDNVTCPSCSMKTPQDRMKQCPSCKGLGKVKVE